MKSKVVVTVSAALLIGVGLVLDFAPQETANALGLGSLPTTVLLLQVLSAAFLGMGFLNWLSRDKPMGGIYSRPLALQNVVLFGVGAIALDRAALHGGMPSLVRFSAITFTVLAVAFGWLMFFHDPVRESQKDARP